MRKTVMILTNSDSGLYDFRKEVLQRLITEGYQVIVSVPEGNYRERIENLGCTYIGTPLNRRGMNPVKDGKLFMIYMWLLKQYKPDIVLTYTIKPNTYGGLACRICRTPYIANITGLGTALENPGMVQKLVVFLYRIGLYKASCVFFQNEYNLKFVEEKGCIHGKTRLLPGSGVNLQEHEYASYPDENEEVRILDVMRVMDAKGAHELLQAAPIIKKEFPNVIFEIAGSYEEESRAKYEPVIKDLQEKGILRYYGYREDLQQIMEKSHIVLNPSYSEGVSNVLLEAAATGRPVIASNIPGCKETFEEDVTGVGCEAKDSESLIEALRKMLSYTPQQREQMGYAGRQYVEKHFDRKQVITIYLEEITQVIS